MATLEQFRGYVEQQRGHINAGRVAAEDRLTNGAPADEELMQVVEDHPRRTLGIGGICGAGAARVAFEILSRRGRPYIS
ncbi:MAG: hypothetical protein PHH00_03865 [Candidatus Nanoarchaeia archaeon]|nr:hypothetical protein [Candidatus Nanoarchaeia archaeon]